MSPWSHTPHPSTDPSLIANVVSMPAGRLIASECACESPTIVSRRGKVAVVVEVADLVVTEPPVAGAPAVA